MQLQKFQANTYRRISVETANPGKILLTLYDAAIRFTRTAKRNIEDGDLGKKGVNITKAYRIIEEFINALDFDVSYELCTNLELVYGYMLEQLSDANMNLRTEPLDLVMLHLQDLRDTWGEAVEKPPKEQEPSSDKNTRIKVEG